MKVKYFKNKILIGATDQQEKDYLQKFSEGAKARIVWIDDKNMNVIGISIEPLEYARVHNVKECKKMGCPLIKDCGNVIDDKDIAAICLYPIPSKTKSGEFTQIPISLETRHPTKKECEGCGYFMHTSELCEPCTKYPSSTRRKK